ncbi:MAG: sodium/proton-translocating pyrophosphatase, partial [Caldilineales bacterium]|nr:sodium/proton-translocating pyrophosphatase [Caldilineales bacterium]
FAVGMESTMVPVITIGIGLLLSFSLAGGLENTLFGLYGVALAAVGMLSTLGITLATDAYGPIADNAGGNAEMSGLPKEVRARTDELDAVGNTTAAMGKGFAISSAALTALALLSTYIDNVRFSMYHQLGQQTIEVAGRTVSLVTATMRDIVGYYDLTLLNPSLITGLFIGAMTVFFFASMTMNAVGRAAGAMVQEVRRQFREIAGLLEGTARPDYARCVEISTAGAQREMVLPSLLAIVIPVAVGVLFGASGVVGLLTGALATGFVMAVIMSNAGGSWDNAKKYVETGHYGGKGSEAHKATVVGDTVGDPFKDTSGPSLNILIKLMSMVSIIFAAVTASTGATGLLGTLTAQLF